MVGANPANAEKDVDEPRAIEQSFRRLVPLPHEEVEARLQRFMREGMKARPLAPPTGMARQSTLVISAVADQDLERMWRIDRWNTVVVLSLVQVDGLTKVQLDARTTLFPKGRRAITAAVVGCVFALAGIVGAIGAGLPLWRAFVVGGGCGFLGGQGIVWPLLGLAWIVERNQPRDEERVRSALEGFLASL